MIIDITIDAFALVIEAFKELGRAFKNLNPKKVGRHTAFQSFLTILKNSATLIVVAVVVGLVSKTVFAMFGLKGVGVLVFLMLCGLVTYLSTDDTTPKIVKEETKRGTPLSSFEQAKNTAKQLQESESESESEQGEKKAQEILQESKSVE